MPLRGFPYALIPRQNGKKTSSLLILGQCKMQIEEVTIYPVALSFSGDFSHARKKGASSHNVVVEVVAEQGEVVGFGEGAPRTYVTGETQESAARHIKELVESSSFPWALEDIGSLWAFVDSLPAASGGNAALCALETAFLDAIGRREKKPIIRYFSDRFLVGRIRYGATVPLGSRERALHVCRTIRKLGLRQIRVKMGPDFVQNQSLLELVRETLGSVDLRIDVNGTWDLQAALEHVPLIRKYQIGVVEQPLKPADPDIRVLCNALGEAGAILMADESVCGAEEAEELFREGCYKMVNVRLSKCGGFRRSLRLIERLRTLGMTFQIGCQLGESGLLSAAGRTLALLCGDALYVDGSYDAFLLRKNVTQNDVAFGPGGEAATLWGDGLGVEVNTEALRSLSGAPLRLSSKEVR